MAVETIKMSSKGQIVIPRDIRKDVDAVEGTIFAVVSERDSIVLKKVATPSKEELIKELKTIAVEGKKRLERKGIKKEDISNIVHKSRQKWV